MKFLGLTQNNSEDFTNAKYVAQKIEADGGKIDTISVDGVEQEIINKNVNIDLTGKADKTAVPVKSITSAKGEALLWNEASGGGAKFTNANGVESFVGVNDGTNGLVAQIYADKFEDGKWNGAKLDVSNTGIYYTVGNAAAPARMIAENEVATIGDITDLATYAIEEVAATAGYSTSYELKNNGVTCGAKINIPKAMIVKSASLKTCEKDDVPVEGYKVGDKYIDLVINTVSGDDHVYILVKELVDAYKADEVTLTLDKATNTFSISEAFQTEVSEAIAEVEALVETEKQAREADVATLTSGKLDIMPGDTQTGGNAYNLPYFFYTVPSADKVEVHTKTVTLDGNKTYGDYSLDVASATSTTAGLMSAADKVRLDAINVPTKVSQLENDVPFLTEHQSLAAYRTSASQDTIDAGKLDIMPGDVYTAGNAYNLPYFFETAPTADKVTVKAKTVTLDGKKTHSEYSLDVNAATTTTAGLMSAADKDKLNKALTEHQDISGKQDVISDLEAIRSGAALGATAIQQHQDISGKQDKPIEPVAGQGVNVPYYFDVDYSADNVKVNDYTIDLLDNTKATGKYSLTVNKATTSTAGLMSAADKIKLDSAVQPSAITDMATQTWVEGKGYLTEHQDISGKLDKPVEPVVGQGINIPYYFDVTYSADKATVRDYTIDLLDKSKAPATYSLDINAATIEKAGLLSAADKVKLNNAITEHQDISGKADITYVDTQVAAVRSEMPTDLSELNNDMGFITANDHDATKLDKPVEPVAGQGVNVPYYFDVNYSTDKVTVRDYTIDLLNNAKVPATYNLDVNAATTSTAGLMSAADKVKVNSIPNAPTADGTYTLECTVVGGVPSFSWVIKA